MKKSKNENAVPKSGNTRLKNAVIRMLAAIVAAAAILAVTQFSIIDLLKGSTAIESVDEESTCKFVNRDVYAILGFYADDVTGSGKTAGRYALVPMGGKLVTVRFSQRYLDSAKAVCDNTYDYINGKVKTLDKYVKVEGTIREIDEDTSAYMYSWFSTNYDQLVEMKMIAETDDYSDYLSNSVVYVDEVGVCSRTWSIITGIAAALLLLYAAVEIVLMATGFYLPEDGKNKLCEISSDDTAENGGDPEINSGKPGDNI